MRADRLISMLLLLENGGRRTAAELADELEVSARTVLRDAAALAWAGVPITTTRGRTGGIELRPGFGIALEALTTEQAGALSLVGAPELAEQLGMAEELSGAHRKLLGALSEPHREAARSWEARFRIQAPPLSSTTPADCLPRLVKAVRAERPAMIETARGSRRLHPRCLVFTAGGWMLEVAEESAPIVVSEITGLRILRSCPAGPVSAAARPQAP